jgi:hypothetical protein
MRRPREAIVCNAFEGQSSGEVRLDDDQIGVLWRAAQHFGSARGHARGGESAALRKASPKKKMRTIEMRLCPRPGNAKPEKSL